MFERKYSSERVVAKLAWIKVLVGEIRIGPGVGQRFVSPRVKAHSWQKGILVAVEKDHTRRRTKVYLPYVLFAYRGTTGINGIQSMAVA